MPLHPTGKTSAAPIVALAVPPAGERNVRRRASLADNAPVLTAKSAKGHGLQSDSLGRWFLRINSCIDTSGTELVMFT